MGIHIDQNAVSRETSIRCQINYMKLKEPLKYFKMVLIEHPTAKKCCS